ncbi:MAG: PIG-L family deacetylase [Planctomycetaceae bacterium]|nr:PIG-L family deacetylase [Planctomycetaceae bacterium]
MRFLALLLSFLPLCACVAPQDGTHVDITSRRNPRGPRVLAVTAHPDDEAAMAGALYKLSTFLNAACDLVVVTNGEGGYKYSTLAEQLYGVELTDEAEGRARLPAIRRAELRESARILGLRSVIFLGEKDHRYTTDVNEVLGPEANVWDLVHVRSALAAQLELERYDFVLALAPNEGTHAHHKAATALAAEAVLAQPPEDRPAMLVVSVRSEAEPVTAAYALEELGVPIGPFVFDRRQRFGLDGKLDYRIISNWVIAAHKSQGTMQLLVNRGDREEYLLFGDRSLGASKRAQALFELLAKPQFTDKPVGTAEPADQP